MHVIKEIFPKENLHIERDLFNAVKANILTAFFLRIMEDMIMFKKCFQIKMIIFLNVEFKIQFKTLRDSI